MVHITKADKILITGGAGLVGHNLIYQLRKQGFTRITCIDKHQYNLEILNRINPDVECVEADLAKAGSWKNHFEDSACLVQLQAQITGKTEREFEYNTIQSTKLVLESAKDVVPYIVHVSSSVVVSVADDAYTRTKKRQEQMVAQSGMRYCILRPTLMFGWFDPKHLGWLSRFMERLPFFPIPGHGRYMRQPLYEQDFCRVIIQCLFSQPEDKVYDIVGQERVDYVDIIREIRNCRGLRTPIVHIPYDLFALLMRVYALFSSRPPFTVDQLRALTAGDEFVGVDMEKEFGVHPTSFKLTIQETFCHPEFSKIILKRT
jgi:nucleoside-diphosphate-sugar epimerase